MHVRWANLSLRVLNSDARHDIDVNVDGGELSSIVNDLIRQYEEAKQGLENLLSSDTECPVDDISKADADVASAFEALLVADLKSSQEIWIRTQYLLAEIIRELDAGSLVDRMAKTVEDDMLKMSQRS